MISREYRRTLVAEAVDYPKMSITHGYSQDLGKNWWNKQITTTTTVCRAISGITPLSTGYSILAAVQAIDSVFPAGIALTRRILQWKIKSPERLCCVLWDSFIVHNRLTWTMSQP